MKLGREQIHHPDYSLFEKLYIAIFGMPIIGLRIRARNIFSLIPKDVNYKNILDAGSGPGVVTFAMARRFPQAQVMGIDLLPKSIASCNRIAEREKMNNITFKCISTDAMPLESKFDLIFCIDILEHIKDDMTTLRRLASLLTPKGVLILHVPALYRRYPIWRKCLNFAVDSHVRTGYERKDIEKKVQDADLQITDSGFTYGFWETLANNLSYMITRAQMKNKAAYALAFPFLLLLSTLGLKARPKTLGAGIYCIATPMEKPQKQRIRNELQADNQEIK